MRGYFNLQAKKKVRLLRMDRSAPQISPKTNYRMCLTLGVTAGCLFLPLVRSIDEWTREGKKEEPI